MDHESESNLHEDKVAVREARLLVWGPIFITINLQKNQNPDSEKSSPDMATANRHPIQKTGAGPAEPETLPSGSDCQEPVDIVKTEGGQASVHDPAHKRVTYIYNHIDHGLNCECIDIKGELLIRSALPSYRKISHGIEFEQVTTNQIKLIITSRVLDNYQEVFQGFITPRATFRIWVLGYHFGR